MKKITFKINPNILVKKQFKKIFEIVDKIEFINIISLDYHNGIKLIVTKFHLKQNQEFENLKLPKNVKIIETFSKKNNEIICLLKIKTIKSIMNKINLNKSFIIWDKPTIIEKEKIIISVSTNGNNLNKIKLFLKLCGKFEIIKANQSDFQGNYLLSNLTSKQHLVFTTAKKLGYYKYPKQISSENLAKELKISKSTLIEHLRKIEYKIFETIE